MVQTAAELLDIYYGLIADDEDDLCQYGTKRHSGRYPWGSGEDPYQHGDNRDFLGRVDELKKKGWVENAENIKKEFGCSMNEYRYEKSICVNERRRQDYERAMSLKADGLNTSEIARKMGKNESSIRSLMNPDSVAKMNEVMDTANFLKEQVDEKRMIDVGKNVELTLGISRDRLDTAIYYLAGEGYKDYGGRIPQPTNASHQTTQRVLCAPDVEWKEIYDYDKIRTIDDYVSDDNGHTFRKFQYPSSLDSKRLLVRYADDKDADGFKAIDKDGIIEIRPGCPDLSLGDDRYSQVRIMVDGTHYLKGMAVYSDNLPDGVDVAFNTNKTREKCPTPKDCLKKIKDDPTNPFGSLIKPDGQYEYDDPKTGEKKLGLINKRAAQGDWSEWKDQLPAQFLAKQSTKLAKKQLDLARADAKDEYDSIMQITNPTIRKYYLNKFAETCDSTATNLSAAALPHQKYHVIIPINTLKDDEVFAPQYKDGTKVALIRYPHEGIYQIPILTVNNRNKLGAKIIGKDSYDAVGIKSKVAEQLSGADFDGDTVMVIPTHDAEGKVKISNKPPLKELEGFDSKSYQYDSVNSKGQYCRNGIPFNVMTKHNEQLQMGMTANLIMDMTLAGADDKELARATKHSMVVIDARKHGLDWKQSERDNNIAELRKIYQVQTNADGTVIIDPKTGEPDFGGSATLLTRSKSPTRVTKRQGQPKVNDPTKSWYDPTKPDGALLYKDSADAHYTKTKVNKRTGEVTTTEETRTDTVHRMDTVEDAYELLSARRTKMELLYADYANDMKQLAREARLESVRTEGQKRDKEAAKTYSNEVASMTFKLNEALKNSVKERQALRMANASINRTFEANPDLKNDKKEAGKVRQSAISQARAELGSKTRKQRNIKLTDSEWEAIQNHAVTDEFLKKLLNNCDPDDLRSRATPKDRKEISSATKNHIKALLNSNYTIAEVADRLDLSEATVIKYSGKKKKEGETE